MTISSFVEGLLIKLEFGDFAHVAQLVEHVLGKDEVSGSSPDMSSTRSNQTIARLAGRKVT